MKCPYCGGEMSSQGLKCEFCGRENEEAVRFGEQLQERSERNRLLRAVLLKEKKPEMVQKLLTRWILILMAANLLLVACSFGIYLAADREVVREPGKGSPAETFYREYTGNSSDYFSVTFFREQNEYIDRLEAGEAPDETAVSLLVSAAYDVVSKVEDTEPVMEELRAFFMGYIGLSEEEMAFLKPDEEGAYPYSLNRETEEKTVALILEKQKERLQ